MRCPNRFRYATGFLVPTFLLLLILATPSAAVNPASDPASSYRPMERFRPVGDFTVQVFRGKEWKEAGRFSFDRFYRERRIDLSGFLPEGETARVRIVQNGGAAAHLDAATLGGIAPSSIRGSEDPLAKKKLSKADFDVIDAFGKTLELRFPPEHKERTLSLVARVEGGQRVGIPFLFPQENHGKSVDRLASFYRYLPESGISASVRNGRLDDTAKPFFREWSHSASGHPSSYTYGWVGSDEKNLYARIDFTGDDTRDGNADYTSVLVKGKGGIREFRLSEADTRWGRPSFAYTGKVPWQHKVYDFAIPWTETGAVPGEPVELAFSAYGTLAGFQPGVYETAAAYDSVNNRYLVVYARYTGPFPGNAFDIYGQLVNADGSFLGPEFVIVSNNWNNRHPAVAFDPVNARYLVVYEDDGDGDGIFGSLLDAGGALLTTINVSYSPAAAAKRFPSVAFNGRNRRYLVAWQDDRPGFALVFDIWGQIVDENGTPVGPDFPISTALDVQANPSVAANAPDGTFLVVFDDIRSGPTDIYGQLVLDDGTLVGTASNVNLVVSNAGSGQFGPRTSFDPVTKRFLTVWMDYRNQLANDIDIYGQFLDNTGTAVFPADTSVNFPVSTNAAFQGDHLLLHSVPAGAFLAAWNDARGGGYSNYGQVVLGDGTLFGSTANTNVPLVPDSDNTVRYTYPMGSAANSSVAEALVSFAADPITVGVGNRLGVRILRAPPLPGGALQVVSTLPGNNAVGVPVGSTISVLFNLPIDRSTATSSNFRVARTSDSAVVAGAFSFSADNTVVIFTPSAALDNNTNYTVTVFNDGITQQGDSSNFLQNDYVFSFTTASAGNSVTLFFQNTPSIFGCAVAPGKGSWKESAGTMVLLVLPLLALFVRKRRARGNRRRRTLFRGFLVLLAAAALTAASLPAQAGPMGPPQASVGAGKFGAAIGYFYTEDKWEPDTASVQSGGITVRWETDKVKQNSVFLRGVYGFSGNCEAGVKVGVADRGAPQGFEDSYAFLAGVEARGILFSASAFSVGPILDFTWYSNYEDDISFSQGGTIWSGTEKIEDSWDLQVGIGIQAPVGKGILYGGPSLYWNRADVTYRISNGTVSLDVDNEYNQKDSFGGFAGIRYPVSDRLGVEIEGQYRSGFSAGATILYSF